jgi:hypothetical protein
MSTGNIPSRKDLPCEKKYDCLYCLIVERLYEEISDIHTEISNLYSEKNIADDEIIEYLNRGSKARDIIINTIIQHNGRREKWRRGEIM